jgi:hypothetical protein
MYIGTQERASYPSVWVQVSLIQVLLIRQISFAPNYKKSVAGHFWTPENEFIW